MALFQLACTHAYETLLWASKDKGAHHTFNHDLISVWALTLVRARLRLEVRVERLGPSLGGRVGGIFGSSVGKVGRFGSGLGEGQL